MSVSVDVNQRQLWIGVIKLGVVIAVLLILGTFLVSLLVPKGSELSHLPVQALIFAIAFSILVSGVRSFLSIIDWFVARKEMRNG